MPGGTFDSSFQPPGDSRWFVNYRSKGRALLLLSLVSDVGRDDAPSRLLPGSHLEMARLLAPAGEEGLPGPYASQESQIPLPPPRGAEVFATGAAGDVFVCHPLLVHAATWPHRGAHPRFLAQPPIAVSNGLNLDGPLHRLSPVARAILLGMREGNRSSDRKVLPIRRISDDLPGRCRSRKTPSACPHLLRDRSRSVRPPLVSPLSRHRALRAARTVR